MGVRAAVVSAVVLVLCWSAVAQGSTGRQKRYLVYPPNGSKTQLILGVGVPTAFDEYSLTIGFKLKYNYYLATNSSYYLEPYVVSQRRDAGCSSLSRWDFYSLLESLLDRFKMDGHACVLRAVCEAARVPISKEGGYAGEVLHLLLTPSSTVEECQRWDREYMAAEMLGSVRGERSCSEMYPECGISLLQLVTTHRS